MDGENEESVGDEMEMTESSMRVSCNTELVSEIRAAGPAPLAAAYDESAVVAAPDDTAALNGGNEEEPKMQPISMEEVDVNDRDCDTDKQQWDSHSQSSGTEGGAPGGGNTGGSIHVNPFSVPPSFRGRGSGAAMNPFSRGSLRGSSVVGGGGGGGGGSNRNSAAYDQNWPNQHANTGPANGNVGPMELWVETKTEDGKSYFYHALTRETTWTKPEGGNVKIMSQAEIEEMNKKQQQQTANSVAATEGALANTAADNADQVSSPVGVPITNTDGIAAAATAGSLPSLLTQPPPTQQQLNQPPPNLGAGGAPGHTQQPPPALHQQPPPFFQPGMHPPNFGHQQTPFGMPPPGYGGYPGHAPWGMPWNQHMHQHGPPATQQEKPAKTLIIKPGVIDPAVIARAAEWSEHRAPDGRPYYYHAGRGESVWEKPQALRDMEAARMAAHSGATPQQAAVAAPQMTAMSHMMGANPLMHMPPAVAGSFDPALAYNAAAVAAASLKANEVSKAAQTAALEKEAKRVAEEKRKKAEDEQKKSAAAAAVAATKPVDKSRPISSTPIAGTPWCVVWTGDARVFFYNPSTRTSVWERPDDLLDREDVDKAVSTAPEQLKGLATLNAAEDKVEINEEVDNAATGSDTTSIVLGVSGGGEADMEQDQEDDNEVIKIRTESESSVEEVPTKKSKIATKQSKKSDANEAAVEAEVRAAKERALVPLETRVKQFKEMLREKDVSAFSTWEKELHKIVFDPRYLLLTSKERKQVFEKYVKDRAEEERKEKRNKMRQKREDFRKLMEEAKLHGKSSFSEFGQRFGKNDRYKAIEKIRERESLFNEYIVDVRRREKEEKVQRKEQIRKEFMEMLRDRADIDRHTRWHDIKKKFESDSRYRAVENSMYREEYFQDFVRQVKDEKRKQRELKDREREREREKEKERERERKAERKSERKLDKERSGRDRSRSKERGKDRDKEKDKEREKDKDRPKEKERDKERHRERGENNKEKDKDKVKQEKERDKERNKDRNGDQKKQDDSEEGEHHDDDDDDEQLQSGDEEENEAERLQKERDRQLRAEQSIREREKEVQRTLAGHLRDRDKEREHHKRDEAIGHFNALLTDLVRNPDLTWKEVKRQLRKDHRWEMIETLDRDDREKIFNEHIDSLMKKKREKFREMLDEITTLELTSIWKDIKKVIKDDPRYLKYSNSDKCEREFRDYIKDKTLNAKTALRELLQECKMITYKSSELVQENPNYLKEIQDILKNDKRYLVLEHLAEDRASIVTNYLEELHKRGPPPPPTASESTRRNKLI